MNMKKSSPGAARKHNTANKYPISPARLMFYSTSALLSLMFACGIITIMLPESICEPVKAAGYAYSILQASSRVTALGAIFITLAAVLDKRYPDSQ